MMHRFTRLMSAAVVLVFLSTLSTGLSQTRKPALPKSLRLYVLDCGRITVANGDSMGFKPGELATALHSVICWSIGISGNATAVEY